MIFPLAIWSTRVSRNSKMNGSIPSRGLICGNGNFDGRSAIFPADGRRTIFKNAIDEFLVLQLVGFHADGREHSLPFPVDRFLSGDDPPFSIAIQPQFSVCVEVETTGLADNVSPK